MSKHWLTRRTGLVATAPSASQHPAHLGPVTEAIDLLTDTLLSHFA